MKVPRANNLYLMLGTMLATAAIAVALCTAKASSTAPAAQAVALRPSTATAQAQSKGPAMWRVSDADSRIYLFGTVHLLPKGVNWTTPAYKAAMADAEVTVTECDVDSAYAKATMAALVYERGVNPSFQSLSDILGRERFEKLAAVAKLYGVNPAKLQRMRPWLATLHLSGVALRDAGFKGSLGVEKTVLADAKAEGDGIATLETVEGQVKMFESLDGPEMIKNFDASLAEIVNIKEQIEPLVAAWVKGDLATLERLSSVEMRRTAPDAYKILLVDRNREWVDTIEYWLTRKQKDYFVAVGAAHLVGPDSVVAMLKKKGLEVERIQ